MNTLPLFYFSALHAEQSIVDLNDDIRHHAVTVLRMDEGEQLMLTNGKGLSATATIQTATKKQLAVRLHNFINHPSPHRQLILGISLLKNAARFEWMLEKVTEIGIIEIFPLRCERTEKQHYKKEPSYNELRQVYLLLHNLTVYYLCCYNPKILVYYQIKDKTFLIRKAFDF